MPTSTIPASATAAPSPASFSEACDALTPLFVEIKERFGEDGLAFCEQLLLRMLDLVLATRRETPGYTGPKS
jgi:hypothetical protein